MTTYDEYRAMMIASSTSACEYIPKMCYAAREEDPTLDNNEIKSRVTQDALATGLARDTINHHIPNEFKDPDKVSAGKKRAEKKKEKEMISVTNDGKQEQSSAGDAPAQSDDKPADNDNPPSFTTAADLIPKVGRKEFYEKTEEDVNEDQQQVIEQLKSELERVGRINERYSKELIELQEAVKKTSFKPAGEVKSFTFNDLPKPDDMNTFSYQNIELPTFRMGLGQLMLTKTKWNIWMERIRK